MGGANGLEKVQVRFLRKFRREVKPVRMLLKEMKVAEATFVAWCGEEEFGRAFRRVTAGVTRDALVDLRISFALCGRIVSGEVMRVLEKEATKGGSDGATKGKKGEATKGGSEGATEVQGGGEQGVDGKAAANPPAGVGDEEGLGAGVQRLCFEVIKVGMGAFVGKAGGRKKKGRRGQVDPVLMGRLQEARRRAAEG